MYTDERAKIIDLLETVDEAIGFCLHNDGNSSEYIELCIQALESIFNYLCEKKTDFSLLHIESDITNLKSIDRNSIIKYTSVLKRIQSDLKYQKKLINEVRVRWKALFLPYSASMWTSLESIWQAAIQDPDCDPVVMPIPYFDIGNPSNITVQYEGNKFPDYVPITPFNQYRIEEQLPDMIFIHNPYDDANNLTRLPEEYFSSNLKKYTKCLVYSPYFTTGSYIQGSSDFQYAMPGIRNSDLIITQSEKVKNIYCSYGHPKSKFLVIGSPKIDSIINKMKQPVDIPEEWKNKLIGRKVFLLNTHLGYFPKSSTNTTKSGDYAVRYHNEILNALLNKEGCALIWRPHPLLKTMLKDRFPNCLEYVNEIERRIDNSDNGVIDRTGDYSIVFRLSDALITTYSSLINEYMVTGKPVMIFQKKATEEAIMQSPINRNINYFRFKPDGMRFEEFISMVCKGEDPLYDDRMQVIKEAFPNMDGTAGENAYKYIKSTLAKM